MRRILFITGTRADYGKIKPLLSIISKSKGFEAYIYVTGMHLLESRGNTYHEILKDGFDKVYIAKENRPTSNTSFDMGRTLTNLTKYVLENKPDSIVVHGDRPDALAGAIVGAFNNIRVIHIEGGEVSGTIDESIRHAITKLSHIHFVANEDAKKRLILLGENKDYIKVIGSPDIDIIKSVKLPSIESVKKHYDIPFENYGILLFHPVTTEVDLIKNQIKVIVEACKQSNKNFIVIYPNNDLGSHYIIDEYHGLDNKSNFRVFPSVRFESFVVLLKYADFIVGNSSAGVREAPYFGIETIDIGSRQEGRYDKRKETTIHHVECVSSDILESIKAVRKHKEANLNWGEGNSAELFINEIKNEEFWNIPLQKKLTYDL